MTELLGILSTGFVLGNGAILTNACMLPLYPGLIALLAGNANDEKARRATGWMGVLVLAGILTMMLFIGFVLWLLSQSFGSILQFVLPLVYGIVIVFGLMLLADRNPFAKLSTGQVPLLKNPYLSAYVYGLLFGPMTLPCTGPIITSAFLLGTSEGGSLGTELMYFLAFGVGFGWPLLVLPLVALPVQRRAVSWLARNHTLLNRASGILLIAVGIFGIITELLPQYLTDFSISETGWVIYWGAVVVLIATVSYFSYRAANQPTTSTQEVAAQQG